MNAITSILIVSSIGAFLALILVIADRIVRNYGECEIDINGEQKLKVQGGASLLESLSQNNIFIPSACGGRGTCGFCRLKVLEGAGPLLPTEEPYLSPEEVEQSVRISCQVRVTGNMRIQIPDELFNIQEFTAICANIHDLTGDMKEFRFELKAPPEIEYIPGQYIQLFTPSYAGNEEVYRAYSVASDPADKKAIDLVIRLAPGGICTTWCFEHLKQGDTVKFNGPYGDFHLSDTETPIIFIAGGSGLAPIKCMLHHMKNTGNTRESVFFFGGRTPADMCYTEEMRDFEKTLENFKFVPVVGSHTPEEKWQGETGLVTDAVKKRFSDLSGHEAYLCGSPGMIDASEKVLIAMKMPEQNIFYDKFA